MLAFFSMLYLACLGVTETLNNNSTSNVTAGIGVYTTPTRFSDDDASARSIATNMLIYSSAVSAYLRDHPSFANTTVSDSTLSNPTSNYVPSNFINSGYFNYISGNYVYIYTMPTSSQMANNQPLPMAAAMAKATKGDYFAGINSGGYLYTAQGGLNPQISIPANIPKNAAVYISQFK